MKKMLYLFVFVFLVALTGCKSEPKIEDKFTIELEEESVSLKMTESYQLKYLVKNNNVEVDKEVVLTISDASILLLEGSTITGLKEGVASVTVSLKDDPSVTTSLNVNITKSIVITNIENSMFVRQELIITYVDVADKDSKGVAFSSSDRTIASVNSAGLVKALKPGIVTITVTSKTNDLYAVINITITEVEITEITIDDLPENIEILDEFSLSATVSPSEASQDVLWESSDSSIATIDEFGHLKVLKVGEVTITATSKIDNTKSATFTFEISVDPIGLMEKLHVENPIRQYVTTYGYNPDERFQWVNGSVSLYFNAELNLDVRYVPIDQNKFTGTYASQDMIVEAENLLKVRSGILHPETKYIIYHDTGNHNPGATAEMHHTYMQGQDNRTNRARSWHYTVDEHEVIQHIPDNEVTWQGDHFDSYAYGIGVETAVNFGADLFTIWHRTAKLMAGFMETYNIGLDGIKQHHDFDIPRPEGGFWNKDCPRTLRNANLYASAIDMVYAEYLVRTMLADYDISFTSLNPSIVDDRGRVIASPQTATRVGYVVNVKGDNYDETTVLYSIIPGVDGTTTVNLEGDTADFAASQALDLQVASLPKTLTNNDASKVVEARNSYEALTNVQKVLAQSLNYLRSKELELHSLDKISTEVVISQVMLSSNSHTKYGYIELYNPTNNDINLNGWTIQFAEGNSLFSVDNSNYNKTWTEFTEGDVIKAKGYYLVQVKEGTANGSTYLPIADAVTEILLTPSGRIVLANSNQLVSQLNDNNVIDLFGYGSVTMAEKASYIGELTNAIIRWGLFDTNDNSKDFVSGDVNPTNSKREKINNQMTTEVENAFEVDTLINALPRNLVLNDESKVIEARNKYNALTSAEKSLVKLSNLLEQKEMEIAGIKDPNLLVIYQAIMQIPRKINNDYTFPTSPGLTITYKAGQDTSFFNLATGVYLKASYAYNPITLVATSNSTSVEFSVNFGVLDSDQTAVFLTGAVAPAAGGQTAEGKGTANEQLSKSGFGGITITVDNKVYFIGKGAFVNLTKPASGTTLTVNDLRPYGSSSNMYNQGLVKGVPTDYKGEGALYYNSSDVTLTLNPSDTYGRNNASFAGYGKLVFSPNEMGSYTVQTKWADSGSDTVRGEKVETLEPGEYLYCPHNYSTNLAGGTWLMQEGTGGAVGVLAPGVTLQINSFKNFK